MLYSHLQHHNDTIFKTQWQRQTQELTTQEDFFTKIYTSHFIARVRKGCSRITCERELETEHKLWYLDPTVMTVTLCLSCSLGLLNRRPRALSSGPKDPSAWCDFPYHISPVSFRSPTQLPLGASNSTGTRTQFNWLIEPNWII